MVSYYQRRYNRRYEMKEVERGFDGGAIGYDPIDPFENEKPGGPQPPEDLKTGGSR